MSALIPEAQRPLRGPLTPQHLLRYAPVKAIIAREHRQTNEHQQPARQRAREFMNSRVFPRPKTVKPCRCGGIVQSTFACRPPSTWLEGCAKKTLRFLHSISARSDRDRISTSARNHGDRARGTALAGK